MSHYNLQNLWIWWDITPMIMLCYVTLRQGDYPGGSDLITWGIKSRAPSPADDRRGSERELKHEKELMYHWWPEVGHMKSTGSLSCWEGPKLASKEMHTQPAIARKCICREAEMSLEADCFSEFPDKDPGWPTLILAMWDPDHRTQRSLPIHLTYKTVP